MAASAIRWGDVPTWVAAIGTSGALILAVLGSNGERRTRRRREEAERRAQARLVTVEAGIGRSSKSGEIWTVAGYAIVHNRSDEPITDLMIKIEMRAAAEWRNYRVEPRSVPLTLPIVDAHASRTVDAPFRVPSAAPPGMIGVEEAATAYFTDHAGLRWARSSNGEIEEVRRL